MGFSIHIGGGGHSPHHHHNRGHHRGGVAVSHTVSSPVGIIIFGLIFFLIGCGLLFGMYKSITKENDPKYVETKGVVVDWRESCDRDGCLYAIVVEYSVEDRDYAITSNMYSNFPDRIGSVVDVKYDQNDPSDAFIAETGESGTLMFGIIGGVFTLVGGFILLVGIKGAKGKSSSFDDDERSNLEF